MTFFIVLGFFIVFGGYLIAKTQIEKKKTINLIKNRVRQPIMVERKGRTRTFKATPRQKTRLLDPDNFDFTDDRGKAVTDEFMRVHLYQFLRQRNQPRVLVLDKNKRNVDVPRNLKARYADEIEA